MQTGKLVREHEQRARMKGASLLAMAEMPLANWSYEFLELEGAGIRIELATSKKTGATCYYIRGQGVSPEAEIWRGSREDLLCKLLEPLGLAVRDVHQIGPPNASRGRIVAAETE